jgi:hypothetical protein
LSEKKRERDSRKSVGEFGWVPHTTTTLVRCLRNGRSFSPPSFRVY